MPHYCVFCGYLAPSRCCMGLHACETLDDLQDGYRDDTAVRTSLLDLAYLADFKAALHAELLATIPKRLLKVTVGNQFSITCALPIVT